MKMFEFVIIVILLMCVLGEAIAHNHDVARCEKIIQEQGELIDEVVAENEIIVKKHEQKRTADIMAAANEFAIDCEK